jgi:hypothetical protein
MWAGGLSEPDLCGHQLLRVLEGASGGGHQGAHEGASFR